MTDTENPDEYVAENADTLAHIIKHSSNTFARSLALAALVEYGDDPTIEVVVEDLERLKESRNK